MTSEDFKDLIIPNREKSKIIIDTAGRVYIENYGGVQSYSAEKVVLVNKLQTINITGDNLYIEAVSRECVWIYGKIADVAIKERVRRE